MKFLNIVSVFLVTCSIAVGQSASTVLASLNIKGSTSRGGDSVYENYIPKLNSFGVLDYSFIPTNDVLYSLLGVVNSNGVSFNTEYTTAISNALASKIDAQFAEFDWLAYNMYSNAVIDSVFNAREDPILSKYAQDSVSSNPVLFTNATSVSLGSGAVAFAENAWQLGAGTNTVQGSLKWKNTVLVDSNGYVPDISVPWAASKYELTGAVSNVFSAITAVSNKLVEIETNIPTSILLRSNTKMWELAITDAGDLIIKEYNQ